MVQLSVTFFKLGINPDISDYMFANKLKHAIIESL